jgi:hypothetical protein
MEPPQPKVSYKEDGFMVKRFKYRIPPRIYQEQAGKISIVLCLGHGSIKDRNREWGSLIETPAGVRNTKY